MWTFYSNLILQKNTAEVKILAKTGRIQPATERRSQLEKESHNKGALLFNYFQVTTSPRPINEVATKKMWLRRKKLFKAKAEVATPSWGCDVDPLMKPQMRSVQENLRLQPVIK